MSEGPPKSAVQLAMEKLARRDAEAEDDAPRSLTDEQRETIAEARRQYDAKVAETRILHESKLAATFEPEARHQLQEDYRRDMARLSSQRDRKIAAVTGPA